MTNSAISGAVAGLASVLALQPLDVLKTRLQEAPNRKIIPTISHTLKNEGIFAFWRGTSTNLL